MAGTRSAKGTGKRSLPAAPCNEKLAPMPAPVAPLYLLSAITWTWRIGANEGGEPQNLRKQESTLLLNGDVLISFRVSKFNLAVQIGPGATIKKFKLSVERDQVLATHGAGDSGRRTLLTWRPKYVRSSLGRKRTRSTGRFFGVTSISSPDGAAHIA